MTLLYVFPHPDDESFGPAPAIARQTREGHHVHLLTLTRGGATRQRERLGLSVEAMGAVREREMQDVARVLGLQSLTVLDLPDGELAGLDPRTIEDAVAEHVRRTAPDVLVTYADHGISGHPDHLAGHAAVKRVFCAFRDAGDGPRRLALFTLVAGHEPPGGGPDHMKRSPQSRIGALVPFTPEDLAVARRALDQYETYRPVIEQHDPLAQVTRGVGFELFGEAPEPWLESLLQGL